MRTHGMEEILHSLRRSKEHVEATLELIDEEIAAYERALSSGSWNGAFMDRIDNLADVTLKTLRVTQDTLG